eukprot:GHVU01156821.1.p2 GENE.GHVU01156821.1~~GHVU01156821.1.p2  ORF type:complete len:109 (-),score=15.66 GHVU01156821.1:68-394(-)
MHAYELLRGSLARLEAVGSAAVGAGSLVRLRTGSKGGPPPLPSPPPPQADPQARPSIVGGSQRRHATERTDGSDRMEGVPRSRRERRMGLASEGVLSWLAAAAAAASE